MPPSLTDTLCTQCGLCCDGSLFADVELAGTAEATRLEILGLDIDEDADRELLVLPCAALAGTRCSIYAHRPRVCRSFECGLLQNARRGRVSPAQALLHIEEAHARIARVHGLLSEIGEPPQRLSLKERCAEAMARMRGASAATQRRRAELESAMSAVEQWIRSRFLAG